MKNKLLDVLLLSSIIIFTPIVAFLMIMVCKNINYNKETFISNNKNNMTVVSCYWKVNNKHGNKYDEWFKNTLKINQRYIFFCDENSNQYIKSFRNNYDTSFVSYPFENLSSHKYAQDNWDNNYPHGTKNSSIIWHEKINLMKLAKYYDIIHDNSTEFYIWIDSGICIFRDREPYQKKLNLKDIHSIPHDKISYSSYNSAFTAGVFIIHRDLIDYVHKTYYDKLEECISIDENNNSFASEQHIISLIKDDHPELFHEIGNDYGSILEIIYSNHV